MASSEQMYEQHVFDWTRLELERGTPTFSQLVTSLPGVYPSSIVSALRALRVLRVDLDSAVESLLNQASSPLNEATPQRLIDQVLPIPHPLDFEWRFSLDGQAFIWDECRRAALHGSKVALIGAPSLLVRSLGYPLSQDTVLLDKNGDIVARLSRLHSEKAVQIFDAFHDMPPALDASVTVLDPPWYISYINAFLWSACRTTRIEGRVMLSLPAVGTRPGIMQERQELFPWAYELGLELIELHEGVIGYASPPFERNALRAEGIQGCPHEWRFGDLAVFHKYASQNEEIHRPQAPYGSREWLEYSINGIRLRIRRNPHHSAHDATADPRLQSILPNDVLPSVSSRDPRRNLADVWTSGNRIYRCDNTHVLSILLDLSGASHADLTNGVERAIGRVLTSLEKAFVSEATVQIEDLVSLEEEELTLTLV